MRLESGLSSTGTISTVLIKKGKFSDLNFSGKFSSLGVSVLEAIHTGSVLIRNIALSVLL
jgi:hypothetical protein